jgi:hypothetical protein
VTGAAKEITMDDTKSLFASRTVWGAAVAIAAALAGALGFSVAPTDQAAALSLVDQILGEWDRIATIAGAALALYGRVKATRRIG